MLTIYLWAILSLPISDKYICDLWTAQITRERMLSACGTLALYDYRVDVYDLKMNKLCTAPAVDLPNIAQKCDLKKPLDRYVIRMMHPKETQKQSLMCYVESSSSEQPAEDEIHSQCPAAMWTAHIIQYAGVKPIETKKEFACPVRVMNIGFGLYDQAASADALITDKPLDMLAGKLIWHGIVRPACAGSGLDPMTLGADACGLASTRAEVIRWQNQYNAEIFSAGITYAVPAHLLKRMMMIESQFWPWWNAPAGEIGVMQVTDNGLDTLFRFDRQMDPFYFERDEQQKLWSRSTVRDLLYCHGCSLEKTIAHIKTTIPIYARMLAAFECRAVTLNPSLVGNDQWRQAVVDYNGSSEYLVKIENGE